MPEINQLSTLLPNSANVPLAVRQRMLMAEALQNQAATTQTPAGKRGIAVGMAQLAAGLMGGVAERNAIDQVQQGTQAVRNAQAGLYEGLMRNAVGGAGAAPQAAGQPSGSPLSAADRDLAIRTIAGEAGGENADGQAGVASVIKNRMASGNYGGNTLQGVITAPKQFSVWNQGDPAGNVARGLDPNSPQYQRIGSIVDGVFSGAIPDPTNGADHYYNPRVARPAWGDALAARNDVMIGNHRFVGGDPGLSRSPQTPAGQLAGTPGSTVTPPRFPNSDPDMPAPNATPTAGAGLPGGMTMDQAFGPQSGTPAMGQPPVPPNLGANPGVRSDPTMSNMTAAAPDTSAYSPDPTASTTPQFGGGASPSPSPSMLAAALMGGSGGGSSSDPASSTLPSAMGAMGNTMPSAVPYSNQVQPSYQGVRAAQAGGMPSMTGLPNSGLPAGTDPTMGGQGGGIQQPIPGSAYAPPASLGGGAIDANVAQGGGMPGPDPSAIGMGAPDPTLTAANPNASALQPSDMLNTAPAGGMGGPAPTPASAAADPTQGGGGGPVDPSMQSLAMALQNYPNITTPGGTTPKGYPMLPDTGQSTLQQGAGIGTVPSAVSNATNSIDAMQAAGLPSFGGLPETNGKKVALSNSPDFGLPSVADTPSGTQRTVNGGLPAPQNATASNVPLSSSDPSSDAGVALAPPQTDSAGRTIVRQTAPTLGGNAPPGMVFASDADTHGDPTGSGSSSGALQGNSGTDTLQPSLSPIGKNANFQTPQAFNLAQAGDAPGGNSLLASLLQGGSPASSAPSGPGASQRMALANALQNRGTGDGSGMPFAQISQPDGSTSTLPTPGSVGPGSAFRQGMNGGNLNTIASQQFANLGGNTPGGMSGSGQNPNLGQTSGAPSTSQPFGQADMMQNLDAILRSPYASSEDRQAALQFMQQRFMPQFQDVKQGDAIVARDPTGKVREVYKNDAPYDLNGGQTRYNGQNQPVASAPLPPEYGSTHDGLIFNKRDGSAPGSIGGQGGSTGFQLLTPEEKQAAGLPVDQPFQKGPNGKIVGMNGQTINIGGAQNAYQDAMAKSVGERHAELANGVEGAQQRLRALNEMSDAVQRIQGAGGTTGLGQQEALRVKSAINSGANVFGFQPFDISDSEVVNKLNKQIAASAAKSLSTRGATNFDFQQMQAANPGLELSPNANQRLIGLAQQAEQRNIALGQGIRDYASRQLAQGAKANPADVEGMITSYDQQHHFTDPLTGQDLTANPRLPQFQGQGGGAPTLGAGGQPGAPAGASAFAPSQAQAATASRTAPADMMAQARAAIASGKSRAAVVQRLQSYGYNPAGL